MCYHSILQLACSTSDSMSKVLIIDDSAQMLHLMYEMVTLFGHEAEVAHSGTEGLEKVETFKPELILLDVMMPGMNGWEFYAKHKEKSDVPVIMVSADASFAGQSIASESKSVTVPLLVGVACYMLVFLLSPYSSKGSVPACSHAQKDRTSS